MEHGIDRERAAEYHRQGWWGDLALADHVGRHARERPDAAAFVGPPGTLTWAGYESASAPGPASARRAPHPRQGPRGGAAA